MGQVYTYWKCQSCNTINRGDLYECPNCGIDIPNGVKYLMPNDPIVIEAIKNGTIQTKGKINVDYRNVISEEVEPENIRNNPNWNCSFCGYQNKFEDITCVNCGANKTDADGDYFNHKAEFDDNNKQEYLRIQGRNYEDYYDLEDKSESKSEIKPEIEKPKYSFSRPKEVKEYTSEISENSKRIHISFDTIKPYLMTLGIILGIIGLIWLFIPITRTANITSFIWNRSITIEKYTLCNESDWNLPGNATLKYTANEIHHYDRVIDHYETKTRQVSETVLDHYETEYIDLGNGQARTVERPVYKTVYHTETYEEPVYKDVPVYKTKYYYTIDRWKYYDSISTSGRDKNPYWPKTDLPKTVANPKYDDLRQNGKSESYYAIIVDDKGNSQRVPYDYKDWLNLNEGDTISYKTFRFSDTPLKGD